MKKIFFFLSIISTIAVSGQTYTGDNFFAKNILGIPLRDTTFVPTRLGTLIYRSADSTVYTSVAFTGRKWKPLEGGDGINNSNTGAGFRLLKPDQAIKTLYAGDGVAADSTTNANGITLHDSTGAIAVENITRLKANSYHVVTSRKKNSNDVPYARTAGRQTRGDGGGGEWYWDAASTETEDTGMVVQVTGITTGRWKRITPDGMLNLAWFDSYPDASDFSTKGLRSALAYYKAHQSTVKGIFIPAGDWRFNDSILIDFNCTLQGATKETTILTWHNNAHGIRFFTLGGNIKTLYINDLCLKQAFGAETFEYEETGLKATGLVISNNLRVWNWQGNGIIMYGNGSDVPATSVNHSVFNNVEIHENRGHGYVITGADANICLINKGSFRGNGGQGILDNSFLGNTYIDCHFDGNANPENLYIRALTRYAATPGDTILYYARHNADVFGHETTLGVPGVATNDWGVFVLQAPQWVHNYLIPYYHPDSMFISGGSIRCDYDNIGSNQFTQIISPYSEQNNPPGAWGVKSYAHGGDMAPSGIESGLYFSAFNNLLDVTTGIQVRYTDNKPIMKLTYDAISWKPGPSDHTGLTIQYDTTRNSIYHRDQETYSPFTEISTAGGSEVPSQSSVGSTWGRSTMQGLAYNTLNAFLFADNVQAAGAQYKAVVFGTGMPQTGTWKAGDFMVNIASGSSDTLFWRCIADGTPGTWDGVVKGGGSGTVTNVASGWGTNFSAITTTGTIIIDSTSGGVTSWLRTKKIVDSLGAIIAGLGGSGVTTVGAFSGSSQANGASISGTTITFGIADATNPGMVSTGNDSWAGKKTITTSGITSTLVLDNSTSNYTQFDLKSGGATKATIGVAGTNGDGFDNSVYFSTTALPFRFFNGTTQFSELGIGGSLALNKTSAADASANLELGSVAKGFLPNRLTAAQRTGIASPASGLIVYDTDSSRLFIYMGSWKGLKYTDEGGGGGNTIYNADDSLAATRTVTIKTGDTLIFLNGNAVNAQAIRIKNRANPNTYFTDIYNGTIKLNFGGAVGYTTTYAPGGVTHSPVDDNSPYSIVTSKNFRVRPKGADRFIVDTTGKLSAPNYGSGSFTGSKTYGLGVTSAGDIIETPEEEGTYMPTLTNTTNIAASTAITSYYSRTGTTVTVWGDVEIDATTALTISEMGFSLPIASSIALSQELSGSAVFEDNTTVQIKGDGTNDRAMFRFTPQSATNNRYSFKFTYKVL